MAFGPNFAPGPPIQYGVDVQRQKQRDAENERRYQESLAASLAGQQYQNQAMGIRNAEDAARMQQTLAALGLNFQGDILNQQMQLGRMGGDIAQTAAYQRDAARNAAMDIARFQYQVRQQRQGMQENIAQTNYGRAMHEVPNVFTEGKNLYGIR